ncbi:MAG: hypothetical protein ACOYVF_09660 [Candidatus Zixiibacteriota bacterium]
MKKSLTILMALFLLTIFFIEGAVMVAPVAATTAPAPTFSAGDWINQGGQIVGCKCPKLKGPCVCEYSEPIK